MTVAQSSAAINNAYCFLGQSTPQSIASHVSAVTVIPKDSQILQIESGQPDFQFYQRLVLRILSQLFTVSPSTESTSISDSDARLMIAIRAVSATDVASSETLGRFKLAIRAISATATTVSDSPTRVRIKVRPITATAVSSSETLGRFKAAFRSISATATTVTGSVARLATKFRTITTEATTSATGIAARMTVKPRSISAESTTISASPARLKVAVRSLSQTVAITAGTVTRLVNFFRAVATQTVVLSDSLQRLASKFRAPATAETTTVSASPIRTAIRNRSISLQSTTLSASLARTKAAIRALSQSISVSGSPTVFKLAVRALSQSVSVTGSVAAELITGLVHITMDLESIDVQDALDRSAKFLRTIAASDVSVADLSERTAYKVRSISAQSVTILEASLGRIRSVPRSLTQSTAVTDSSLSRFAFHTINLLSSISVSETLAKVKTKIRSITAAAVDAVVVSVTLIKTASGVYIVEDAITISANAVRDFWKNARLFEQYGTLASATPTAYKNRSVPTQNVASSDSITRTRTLIRAITSTIVVLGSVARAAYKFRGIFEENGAPASVVFLAKKMRAVPTQTVTVTAGSVAKQMLRALSITATATTITGSVARMAMKHILMSAEQNGTLAAVSRQVMNLRSISLQTVAVVGSVARWRVFQRLANASAVNITGSVATLKFFRRGITSAYVGIAGLADRKATKNRIIASVESVVVSAGSIIALKKFLRSISVQSVAVGAGGISRFALRLVSAVGAYIQIQEQTSRAASFFRSIPLEAYSISSSVIRAKIRRASVSETVSIGTGLISLFRKYTRAVAVQTVLEFNNIAVRRKLSRSITAAPVSWFVEMVIRHKTVARSNVQTTNISELITSFRRGVTQMHEVTTVVDRWLRALRIVPGQRVIDETVNVFDFVGRVKKAIRNPVESIGALNVSGLEELYDVSQNLVSNPALFFERFLSQNWLLTQPGVDDIVFGVWWDTYHDIHLKVLERITFDDKYTIGWTASQIITPLDVHIFVRQADPTSSGEPENLRRMRTFIEKLIGQNPAGLRRFGVESMRIRSIMPVRMAGDPMNKE